MAITNNSLSSTFGVYAQESLEQFIATMPAFNLFTKNFDTNIANGGQTLVTRIPNTYWSTPNDLTNGWASTSASFSNITTTLKLRDYDVIFDELQYATVTPELLKNSFFNPLAKQMANGIVVDALNNVTSSVFTNTMTVATSSLFSVTGSTSLQSASIALDNNEIPFEDRFAMVTPSVYQGITNGILPTYIYGNSDAVQKNVIPNVLGFSVQRYMRFYGATKPNGGASYSSNDKLVGIVGNKNGLVGAMRAPVDINNGLVQSYTATDSSSGISLQYRLVYDASQPGWRMAVVALFGTSAGNTKAIIPILTQSF